MVRHFPRLIQTLDAMFYAVRYGRKCGIYKTWDECKEQVHGFSGARFKKFKTRNEALEFMMGEKSISKIQKKSNLVNFKKAVSTVQEKQEISEHALKQRNSKQNENIPVVYTDGGCYANGHRRASAGIGVFWGEGDQRNVSERLQGLQTNQRAELNAAIRALETAMQNGIQELEIRTDSMYTINCATNWISTWRRNEWRTASGKEVKNQTDIMRLAELCEQVRVNWVHVRGHAGIFGNEQADRLSKNGANKA